jgi:hypothetical protein
MEPVPDNDSLRAMADLLRPSTLREADSSKVALLESIIGFPDREHRRFGQLRLFIVRGPYRG